MGAVQPVDISHLDRYTGGDRAINEEVLQLFETSCSQALVRLEALLAEEHPGALPKDWKDTAHTIKGAARGIGAFALADAAAAAEGSISDRRAAIAAFQRMKTQSEAVHAFILDFLAGRI